MVLRHIRSIPKSTRQVLQLSTSWPEASAARSGHKQVLHRPCSPDKASASEVSLRYPAVVGRKPCRRRAIPALAQRVVATKSRPPFTSRPFRNAVKPYARSTLDSQELDAPILRQALSVTAVGQIVENLIVELVELLCRYNPRTGQTTERDLIRPHPVVRVIRMA